MNQCIHCNTQNKNTDKFCGKCGHELMLENSNVETADHTNNLPSMGLALFAIALVGFDFLLPVLFDYLSLDTRIPFYISTLIYGFAIAVSVLGVIDYQRKRKQGFRINTRQTSTAFTVIVMSFLLVLMNVSQVILK